jgi:hypothetical protein
LEALEHRGLAMVPIPYALTYKTTLRGHVPKLVQCEQCGQEYVYLLEQTVVGQGTSFLFLDNQGAQERSAAQAEAALRKGLEEGCEVVPCPACGRVQQHMIPRARQLRHRWMLRIAIGLLAAAGVIALPALVNTLIDGITSGMTAFAVALWVTVGLALGCGIALLIWRRRLTRDYDPNREPEGTRKSTGQRLAVSKEEFMRMAQEVEAN